MKPKGKIILQYVLMGTDGSKRIHKGMCKLYYKKVGESKLKTNLSHFPSIVILFSQLLFVN